MSTTKGPRTQPPPPVSKERLAALLSDPVANDAAVKTLLWDLAWFVGKEIKGLDHEDAQGIAYQGMLAALPTYAPDSDPFAYFFQAGRWKAWRAAAKERKQPRAAIVTTIAPEKVVAVTPRRREPIGNMVKPRATLTDPLDALDRAVLRIRDAITRMSKMERFDTDSPEYRYVEAGISVLQELRFEVTGEYLVIRTPTVGWSAKRALPRAY